MVIFMLQKVELSADQLPFTPSEVTLTYLTSPSKHSPYLISSPLTSTLPCLASPRLALIFLASSPYLTSCCVPGVVTVSTSIDREKRDSYTLTITASDLGSQPQRTSVQMLITVIDVNDNRPLFNMSSLQGAILENSPAGTSVMRIIATDADIGMNAQLVFNFTSMVYSDVFALDSATGEITAKKLLDREKQDRYTLKISVSDHGDPRLSSSADVTITVIDVDDNCPKFEPAVYNRTIRENLPFNQSIVQVTATDVDVKDNEKMMYAIWTGNQGGAFIIDRHGMEIHCRYLFLFLITFRYYLYFFKVVTKRRSGFIN